MGFRAVLACALASASFGAASAQEPLGPVAEPIFLRTPTGEQVRGVYPDYAKSVGLAGAATLECVLNVKGQLEGCEIFSESPAGARFGAAALKLTRYFRYGLADRLGQPVAGRSIRVPFVFRP